MAEKGESSPSSTQNLVCPLCLDIFEDATLLTCGHTFCRKCLKHYDVSHQDLDHMVCPLCRKTTKFSENRVEGLPANVTVNGLVDDYHSIQGGENAFLELQPKCTVCETQKSATSFCSSCNTYMCDKCSLSHQQLALFFKGHQLTSVDDVLSGKTSIDHITDKCAVHKHENKDLFCEKCNVHICLKCVIVEHRDHQIKNQQDFEKQLQKKVEELTQRCKAKKTELEKNIRSIEIRRQEVHDAVQKLQADVNEAYNKKARQLAENQRILNDEIQSLQTKFNEDLDTLKGKDRQKIKSITSTATLVAANDRLGRLETDSLAAHTLLCEELDGLLKEATDKTSAADISETAQHQRFVPADDGLLDLGKISSTTMRVAKDLGKMSSTSLRIVKEVDLPCATWGIAKKSEDSVAVALHKKRRIYVIDCAGSRKTLSGVPSRGYYDIAIQRSGNIVLSYNSSTEMKIHDTDGTELSTIYIPPGSFICPRVNLSHSDEIIVINGTKNIHMYDPSGNILKQNCAYCEEHIETSVFNQIRCDSLQLMQ